ncbi:MAG: prolipoprotein diacylglyceryl transferase [Planctomycetota bacterium]
MYPQLVKLPLGLNITTYGFFLMIGFLTAVWFAMRRATRVGVDPDKILDVSFFSLIGGVVGARIQYVIHYWDPQFATAPNRIWAVLNIAQGGLEFLGGFLGACVVVAFYLITKKQSARLFLDILAPGAMWGLAIGRIGCYFNGCCFGGLCTTDHQMTARFPWAVQFPYGSPPQMRQWEDRQTTLPAELIISAREKLYPSFVPDQQIRMSPELRDGPKRAYQDALKAVELAKKENADAKKMEQLDAALKQTTQAFEKHRRDNIELLAAQQYPSRVNPSRLSLVSELEDLANASRSLPVHPTQLYATMNALILCALLAAVFNRRRRHGVVIGLVFVLYPISRFFEEIIRTDNPHEFGGLTISQTISFLMFLGGVAYMIVLYKWLPIRSPLAANAAPAQQGELEPSIAT